MLSVEEAVLYFSASFTHYDSSDQSQFVHILNKAHSENLYKFQQDLCEQRNDINHSAGSSTDLHDRSKINTRYNKKYFPEGMSIVLTLMTRLAKHEHQDETNAVMSGGLTVQKFFTSGSDLLLVFVCVCARACVFVCFIIVS